MADKTYDMATIPGELKRFALENPEETAFVFWDKHHNRTVLTRQDVWDKSTKAAVRMKRLGVKKGDIVCNTLTNSQERLLTTYGVILLGATLMHGQKLLADGEDIVKGWKQSRCRFIIVDPCEKNGPNEILERLKRKNDADGTTVYEGLPSLSLVIPIKLGGGSSVWLEELDKETELFEEDHKLTQEDVPFILTTSGSTGFAKLVPHTYRSIFSCRQVMSVPSNYTVTILNTRSLGWTGGFPVEYPLFGFKRVLLDFSQGLFDSFHSSLIDVAEKEHIDMASFVASDVQCLMDELDKRGQHSLTSLFKILAVGGGPISAATMTSIGRLTDTVSVSYASTELLMICGLTVTDPSSYHNTLVGSPVTGVSIKILDDDMNQVPNGLPGEIYVRSKSMANEYFNDPIAAKESFLDDGWFRTSDIGHIDDKGQLYVYCRKSNAINHKGFIHYPGWMETRLNKHPDIKKCVLIGIPDPTAHEEMCLCVIKEDDKHITAEQLRDICKDLFLTDDDDKITPIPKFYLFFETFPLNNNHKLDRKSLKAIAMKKITEDNQI